MKPLKGELNIKVMLFVVSGIIFGIAMARADIGQMKIFKGVFTDVTTLKCIGCHDVKMPKKDGDHGPNVCGNEIISAANAEGLTVPTANTYESINGIEDCVKNAEAAAAQ